MKKKTHSKQVQRVSRLEGEWLDTPFAGRTTGQRSLNRKNKSKEKSKKSHVDPLPIEMTNATVTEVHPKLCRVLVDELGEQPLCTYRRVGVFYHEFQGFRQRTPVSVGDRVLVKTFGSSDGVVEGIALRKNQFARTAPGKEGMIAHVMGANLDAIVIVSSTSDPEFNIGIVDRLLVAAVCSSIEPVLVVNKADLIQQSQGIWDLYRNLGIQVALTSAKQQLGIHQLTQLVKGKRVAFCGHSGVGKTSLLNLILQRKDHTQEVNAHTGKGKHTTTGSRLFVSPDGTQWIDTPGIKEFRPAGLNLEQVRACFPEFNELCQMDGCFHLPEQECPAQQSLRYESYLHLMQSIAEDK